VTTVSSRVASRWSDDAFLDRLRLEGDPQADECYARIVASGKNFGGLFEFLNSNDTPLPVNLTASLGTFLTESARTPMPDGQPVAWDRLARGADVFATHACCSALVLLLYSLPAGYAAPNLSKVLVLSGDLNHHPYKRLLGVLQMMVNVTTTGGFAPTGRAMITAPKLRLLHAGVRSIVRRSLPEYESQYGVPVNHEDMLATIMGFSLLVVRGLQELGVPLSDDDAEHYFYLWRVYALAMGMHPTGEPDSTEFLPADLTEADAFYRSYSRRHYRDASENPEGVELTRANLMMMQQVLGRSVLKLLGLGAAPRIYMQRMLGADGLVQRGVAPVPWHPLAMHACLALPRIWTRLMALADRRFSNGLHQRVSEVFFQGMIDRSLGGQVTFLIPESLSDLAALTRDAATPNGERRVTGRRMRQSEIRFADRRGRPDRRLKFRQAYWRAGH
jgi:hypothetical protein